MLKTFKIFSSDTLKCTVALVPSSLELNYLRSTCLAEVVVVVSFRAVKKDQAQNLVIFALYLPLGYNEPSTFQEWAL